MFMCRSEERQANMYSPGEILNLALLIEENGEAFYISLAEHTDNYKIRSILKRLAEEERKHRNYFLELKRYVDKLFKPDAKEKISRFLTAEAVGSKLFSMTVQDAYRIENIEEAIRLATTLEEDSILFYELLKSLSEEEDTLEILDLIIEEENSHVNVLKTILRDFEQNSC